MNTIKWELEDLAFGTLFPKRFEEINRLIGEHQPQREALLRQVTQKVSTDLKAAKIKAETTGRPKHLYSIYQKMIVRGRDFNDIYDLVGVRILVDTVRDCYAALGVIHANWQPVPGRFKDYIAMPKFNMYQSLHTRGGAAASRSRCDPHRDAQPTEFGRPALEYTSTRPQSSARRRTSTR